MTDQTCPPVDTLINGYRRFMGHGFASNAQRYHQLGTAGQSPDIMVIACADSRVDPSTIFDSGPGEMFVVRNVANVVPRYAPDGQAHGVSAALEFAVKGLGVGAIVVMGHAQCGGVKALLQDGEPGFIGGEFVGPWMARVREILDRVMASSAGHDTDTVLFRMEEENIRLGLANLMTFPWIAERVKAGTLSLHGMHFGIASGRLAMLDPQTDRFEDVSPKAE
ncbi:MAG: carbonic anhydrase [Pseudomonadota bacterium]|nr:carbonic anhydrase [Pseudomonadota bacterium]